MDVIIVGIVLAIEKRKKKQVKVINIKPTQKSSDTPNHFPVKVPIKDKYRLTPVHDHLKYN